MKRLTSSTLTIALASAVLVLSGIGVTMAATGGTFLLGKSNTASTTTSLTNSAGTALSLNSKTGTAPLKVNRTTKVSHLNADLLDGLDSTALQRRATGSCATGTASLGLTGTLACATPVTAFTTSGAHTYTVPAGVTQVQVRMWGAGGGGSFNSDGSFVVGDFSGSGGGQGSFVEVLVPVQAGQVLTATLGAAGSGEAWSGGDIPATDGGASVLSRSAITLATAPGGKAAAHPTGSCGAANVGGAGGAAGSVVSPATGLATTPGLPGAGGVIRCASESPPGGAGGGSGFAGAGGGGPSYTGNFDAGAPGSAGVVVFTPVG